jgi:hypothetical protein
MCKQTLTRWLESRWFWSIEPIWNIFIIWCFSSVGNSNKWCSNETLVGTKIQTSNLQDCMPARYQLSYDTTLIFVHIWVFFCIQMVCVSTFSFRFFFFRTFSFDFNSVCVCVFLCVCVYVPKVNFKLNWHYD